MPRASREGHDGGRTAGGLGQQFHHSGGAPPGGKAESEQPVSHGQLPHHSGDPPPGGRAESGQPVYQGSLLSAQALGEAAGHSGQVSHAEITD